MTDFIRTSISNTGLTAQEAEDYLAKHNIIPVFEVVFLIYSFLTFSGSRSSINLPSTCSTVTIPTQLN